MTGIEISIAEPIEGVISRPMKVWKRMCLHKWEDCGGVESEMAVPVPKATVQYGRAPKEQAYMNAKVKLALLKCSKCETIKWSLYPLATQFGVKW